MLLMAILTLGTYWMVQMNEPNLDAEKQKRHVPDYIMDGIVVTTLGPEGNTKFRVVGQKLIHYEDDASSEIDWPIARRFHETKPAITIKSDKGCKSYTPPSSSHRNTSWQRKIIHELK
jgi:lipopolysaccharide export system protein LptC